MKKLLFENIGLKITAVCLAVILWFFVTSRGQTEVSLDVPIEFKNIPAKLGIVSSSAKTVGITLRGQDRLMRSLKRGDLRAELDLGKAKRGEGVYPLTSENIVLPYSLSVIGIAPASIRVKLDEIMTKTMTVQPVFNGGGDGRSRPVSVSVDPPTVRVRGFRSDIKRMTVLKTEPIDTSDVSDEGSFDVGLDTAGASLTVEPETVNVKIVVRRKHI